MSTEKNTTSSFLDLLSRNLKGPKVIDTPKLYIEGNIMKWDDNMLQLSNVISVSTVPQGLLVFPLWTFLMILAGIAVFRIMIWLALIIFALTGIIIYFWYKRNEELKTQSHLILHTNSGKVFSFLFSDRVFLKQVFDVLGAIIVDGQNIKGGIYINVSNNKIQQGASLLNDMKIK